MSRLEAGQLDRKRIIIHAISYSNVFDKTLNDYHLSRKSVI